MGRTGEGVRGGAVRDNRVHPLCKDTVRSWGFSMAFFYPIKIGSLGGGLVEMTKFGSRRRQIISRFGNGGGKKPGLSLFSGEIPMYVPFFFVSFFISTCLHVHGTYRYIIRTACSGDLWGKKGGREGRRTFRDLFLPVFCCFAGGFYSIFSRLVLVGLKCPVLM